MIIRETEKNFIMVTQHDHARLSGDVAKNLYQQLFIDTVYLEDVLLAVYEHDRSWQRLDDTPIWNDKDSVPFSFTDYPLLPKLILYKQGLDEIEVMNEYSALICSLHYSSFRHIRNSKHPDCVKFGDNELKRQTRIKDKFKEINEDAVLTHFRLLQLCDLISLYVCLNEAGSNKENEHREYRDGFENSQFFNVEDNSQQLIASWLNKKEIIITPSPFENGFLASLKLKSVSKNLIKQLGIARAYKESNWIEQEVCFVKHSEERR